ncbi:hypothetical protein CEUSTIGMA_g12668.t1 [Chlamydomonas eustigma]|uniref:Coilin tudor domain-containing protein n=1 Tax=Chlamydomonas eustigma TaxID=1157962 RepID=A0A250XQB3_9CHLO|nr:hypothetical protein CEUSTIGMA_g12668.t1 [Chlamydomonas eustigma]|eukprot:GAX85248.1 hypothetical protein CEUSTIGMA_g12668.t1 [Chlamydomonas eustigma]
MFHHFQVETPGGGGCIEGGTSLGNHILKKYHKRLLLMTSDTEDNAAPPLPGGTAALPGQTVQLAPAAAAAAAVPVHAAGTNRRNPAAGKESADPSSQAVVKPSEIEVPEVKKPPSRSARRKAHKRMLRRTGVLPYTGKNKQRPSTTATVATAPQALLPPPPPAAAAGAGERTPAGLGGLAAPGTAARQYNGGGSSLNSAFNDALRYNGGGSLNSSAFNDALQYNGGGSLNISAFNDALQYNGGGSLNSSAFNDALQYNGGGSLNSSAFNDALLASPFDPNSSARVAAATVVAAGVGLGSLGAALLLGAEASAAVVREAGSSRDHIMSEMTGVVKAGTGKRSELGGGHDDDDDDDDKSSSDESDDTDSESSDDEELSSSSKEEEDESSSSSSEEEEEEGSSSSEEDNASSSSPSLSSSSSSEGETSSSSSSSSSDDSEDEPVSNGHDAQMKHPQQSTASREADTSAKGLQVQQQWKYECLPILSLTDTTALKRDDIIAYKLLEVGPNMCPQVSEPRSARVLSLEGQDGIRLAPWPNPHHHPLQPRIDEWCRLQEEQQEEEEEEAFVFSYEDSPFFQAGQYLEDGVLVTELSNLVEVRGIEVSSLKLLQGTAATASSADAAAATANSKLLLHSATAPASNQAAAAAAKTSTIPAVQHKNPSLPMPPPSEVTRSRPDATASRLSDGIGSLPAVILPIHRSVVLPAMQREVKSASQPETAAAAAASSRVPSGPPGPPGPPVAGGTQLLNRGRPPWNRASPVIPKRAAATSATAVVDPPGTNSRSKAVSDAHYYQNGATASTSALPPPPPLVHVAASPPASALLLEPRSGNNKGIITTRSASAAAHNKRKHASSGSSDGAAAPSPSQSDNNKAAVNDPSKAAATMIIPAEGAWSDIAQQLKQRRLDLLTQQQQAATALGTTALGTTPLSSPAISSHVKEGQRSGQVTGSANGFATPTPVTTALPVTAFGSVDRVLFSTAIAPSPDGDPATSAHTSMKHRSARPGARRSALGPLLNHLRRLSAAGDNGPDLAVMTGSNATDAAAVPRQV